MQVRAASGKCHTYEREDVIRASDFATSTKIVKENAADAARLAAAMALQQLFFMLLGVICT